MIDNKKQMTFEDIEKINYKQINKLIQSNSKQNDEFNPNDYIDIDNSLDREDEILRKFNN